MIEHPGSRELYDRVATWDPSRLLFSKEFGWERWGLLGILSDYILHYTQGNIIEIGVCETSIYFSKLSERYNRKVYHCDIQHSVIENCKTVPGYFGKNSQVFCMDSDTFFNTVKFEGPMALIFIDGDHMYEQVKKDFENAVKLLAPNGYIFMHDTSPPNEDWIGPSRCGTVYKLRREIEANSEFELFTFTRSAWDVGLSMIRKKKYPYVGN